MSLCVIFFPSTMNITISAMLVACSEISFRSFARNANFVSRYPRRSHDHRPRQRSDDELAHLRKSGAQRAELVFGGDEPKVADGGLMLVCSRILLVQSIVELPSGMLGRLRESVFDFGLSDFARSRSAVLAARP